MFLRGFTFSLKVVFLTSWSLFWRSFWILLGAFGAHFCYFERIGRVIDFRSNFRRFGVAQGGASVSQSAPVPGLNFGDWGKGETRGLQSGPLEPKVDLGWILGGFAPSICVPILAHVQIQI